MKNVLWAFLMCLVVSAGAKPARADFDHSIVSKMLDSSQDVRAGELTRLACADKAGMAQLRSQIVQKVQALNEEEKALILQMEATPEDTQFTFQKKNLKGHANRKGYESVLLTQRVGFIDQALERCP